jgi:hypothetical protein
MDDFIPLVPDGNLNVLVWMAARESAIHWAMLSTKGRPEELHALLADNFFSVKSGYSLGSTVPGGDFPVLVQGHHTLGDAVENRLKQLLVFHFLYPLSLVAPWAWRAWNLWPG